MIIIIIIMIIITRIITLNGNDKCEKGKAIVRTKFDTIPFVNMVHKMILTYLYCNQFYFAVIYTHMPGRNLYIKVL